MIDNNNLVCPICGKQTRVYMGNARKDLLCGTHANELRNGKIKVDEKGLFIDSITGDVLNNEMINSYTEENKSEVLY